MCDFEREKFPAMLNEVLCIFSALGIIHFVKQNSCFIQWVKSIFGETNTFVHIDGKSLTGSRDDSNGKKMLHLVHAWASGQNILLGQIKTEEKSNEITAIPELLALLDLVGSIVTIDAMGC